MHTFSVGPWFKNVACLTSLLFFMETWNKAVRDPYTYCLEQPPPSSALYFSIRFVLRKFKYEIILFFIAPTKKYPLR